MKKRTRNKWGGRRAGAGRPPSRARSSERHKERPAVTHPVHVTALVTAQVARVLRADVIARAIELAHARADFRIVHLAIRDAQLELIVEAADKRALARGMQGFQVSAARSLNRAARRAGTVFADRYHARALASRRALTAAIARLPRNARARLGRPTSPLFTVFE